MLEARWWVQALQLDQLGLLATTAGPCFNEADQEAFVSTGPVLQLWDELVSSRAHGPLLHLASDMQPGSRAASRLDLS